MEAEAENLKGDLQPESQGVLNSFPDACSCHHPRVPHGDAEAAMSCLKKSLFSRSLLAQRELEGSPQIGHYGVRDLLTSIYCRDLGGFIFSCLLICTYREQLTRRCSAPVDTPTVQPHLRLVGGNTEGGRRGGKLVRARDCPLLWRINFFPPALSVLPQTLQKQCETFIS